MNLIHFKKSYFNSVKSNCKVTDNSQKSLFSILIETLFDRHQHYFILITSYSMNCKEEFTRHYGWFEALSLKRGIHCGGKYS
ncbi:MAG: hypothetical protein HOD60_00135 [Candidatus Nitrosopelagicus sp.]|jgi:hypothetical protein|nr:hypothetical protein [Candidatus Nitrosopelagicus sp.]